MEPEERPVSERTWRETLYKLAAAPLLFCLRILFRALNRERRQVLLRTPMLSSAYGRLAGFISSAMRTDQLTARVHGLTMYLDPQEEAGRNGAFLWGEFEPATVAVFQRLLARGDIIIDVGAHWGYYTLLAATLCGDAGKVFAFEPHPKNYALLTRNIEANHLTNVQAFQRAVSDRSGEAVLFEAWFTGGHSLRALSGLAAARGGASPELNIETVALDDFFGDSSIQPRLVKIDIEGAEPLALSGMKCLIERCPQLVLIMEFNPEYLEGGGAGFLELLAAQGFEFAIIDDERRKLELGPISLILTRALANTAVKNLLLTREMKLVAPMLGYKGAPGELSGSLKVVDI